MRMKSLGPLLAATLFGSLPAAAMDDGITDTTIKLGTQAPMSGVVAMYSIHHETDATLP